MKNKTLLSAIIATCLTIFILAVLSFVAYPATDNFEWASISPVTIYNGFVFTVGFSFGFSTFWSYVIVSVVILLFGISLYRITRRLMAQSEK